jgi:flavin-binding protein dodecin
MARYLASQRPFGQRQTEPGLHALGSVLLVALLAGCSSSSSSGSAVGGVARAAPTIQAATRLEVAERRQSAVPRAPRAQPRLVERAARAGRPSAPGAPQAPGVWVGPRPKVAAPAAGARPSAAVARPAAEVSVAAARAAVARSRPAGLQPGEGAQAVRPAGEGAQARAERPAVEDRPAPPDQTLARTQHRMSPRLIRAGQAGQKRDQWAEPVGPWPAAPV